MQCFVKHHFLSVLSKERQLSADLGYLNLGSFNQNSLAASKRRRGRKTCGWFALGRTFLAPSLRGAAALLFQVTGRLAGFPSGRDVLFAVLLAIHPRWPGSVPCRQKSTSSPGAAESPWTLNILLLSQPVAGKDFSITTEMFKLRFLQPSKSSETSLTKSD